MAIRLKDIARELNVSVITVSKALRGNTDISEATRKRILDRMRELNYQPNMTARALATGHSSIIGLIVPDLVHPFFAELAKSLGGILRLHANGLILASSEEDPEIEHAEIHMMLARGVDALVIASCQPALKGFYGVEDQRTPYVLLDRDFPHLRANFIGTDDYAGGVLATNHLLEIGRKRVAHIGGPDLSPAADRLRGYQWALRQRGLDIRQEYVIARSHVEETGDKAGHAAMQELLRLKRRPDAVFCYNDVTAIGAMQATLEAGLSIPGDIAFVGFGNMRYCEYLRVPLTSLDQSTAQLGEGAALLALDLARAKQIAPRTTKLNPTLLIRESTVANGHATTAVSKSAWPPPSKPAATLRISASARPRKKSSPPR